MAFILFLKLGSCEYAKLETFYPMRKLLSDTKWQSKINTHLHKYKIQDTKIVISFCFLFNPIYIANTSCFNWSVKITWNWKQQFITSPKTAFQNLLWVQEWQFWHNFDFKFISISYLIGFVSTPPVLICQPYSGRL